MNLRVLVVEDDRETREALRGLLVAAGCVVDDAADGLKGIGCLAQRRYDVVYLDLVLPVIGGLDVMEYIASTDPALLSSVVVVTGLDVEEVRALYPGVCEAISKPVIPGRVMASLRRCTSGERQAGISVA